MSAWQVARSVNTIARLHPEQQFVFCLLLWAAGLGDSSYDCRKVQTSLFCSSVFFSITVCGSKSVWQSCPLSCRALTSPDCWGMGKFMQACMHSLQCQLAVAHWALTCWRVALQWQSRLRVPWKQCISSRCHIGHCFTKLCDDRQSTINVASGPCRGLAGHCSRNSQGGTGLDSLAEVLQHVIQYTPQLIPETRMLMGL